jgi:uncharacterized protein with PQ loop repeat
MPNGSQVIHHIQKQKSSLEEVIKPKTKFRIMLDRMVYLTGAASVLMAIPQVVQIWGSQSAQGVSFITWFTFLINAVIWSVYGFYHKEMQIIVMYIAYFFIDLFIVSGIIIYG